MNNLPKLGLPITVLGLLRQKGKPTWADNLTNFHHDVIDLSTKRNASKHSEREDVHSLSKIQS